LVLFLVSALLQLNDPDPLAWAAVYGSAAAACAYAMRRRPRWWLFAGIAAIALVWALSNASEVLSADAQLSQIAESMSAATPEIEQMRELLGLFIIAGWMGVLVARARLAARNVAD